MSEYKSFEDNMLYKISMYILEYIIISLFIVVASICSFGILFYPSISASYYYYYQRRHHQDKIQFKRLITGIKNSYKQTIPLGIIVLGVIYVFYVNYSNIGIFGGNTTIYYSVLIGSSILLIHSFYTLQLVTYFNVSIVRAVNLSTYFMINYLVSTITVIALLVALIAGILLNPAIIIIILGIFIHLSSNIFMMIFKKHSPEEVNENESN